MKPEAMPMSRRHFLRLLGIAAGAAMAAPILQACGPSAAPAPTAAPTAAPAKKEEAAPTKAPEKAAAAAATPTAAADASSQTPGFKLSPPPFNKDAKAVLTFLNCGTSQTESMHQSKWADQWNKQNADIQVDLQYVAWADELTKTQAYLAAGTPPDVAWYCGNTVQEWFLKGWIQPLDDLMGDVKANYTDDLFRAGSPSMSVDGKQWLGVPFCQYAQGLIIRKDVYTKAGITDLATINTWDGWFNALEKINKPPEMYAYEFPQHPDMLTGIAGYFFDANGLTHIADFRASKKDAYIQTMDFLKKICGISAPAAKAWRHGDQIAAWCSGNIASIATGSYFFGDIIPAVPQMATRENMAALVFPYGPGRKKGSTPTGFCGYMMFKDSKHKEEAAKFLKYYASCDADNEFPMNMSPCKNVNVDSRVNAYKMYSPDHYQQVRWWYEDWQAIMKNADVSYAQGYIPAAEIEKIWQDNFTAWAYENKSTSQAYDDLKAQILAVMKNPLSD